MLKTLGLTLWKLVSLLFFAWTTPRTWVDTELVTASLMNTHVRDNLNALHNRLSDRALSGTQYTTTSSSFAEISTDLRLEITPTTDLIEISFAGAVVVDDPGSVAVCFDVDLNGSMLGGNGGIAQYQEIRVGTVGFTVLASVTPNVAYTIKFMWKQINDTTVSSLTCRLGGALTGYTAGIARTYVYVREA